MRPRKRNTTDAAPLPAPKRRAAARGSASQPIAVDTQPPEPSPTPSSAVDEALHGETFESQLCDARDEADIIAPAEGSEEVTVALSDAIEEAADEGGFEDDFNDNHNGIDWLRLPRFTAPPQSSRCKLSWIFQHGYRVVLAGTEEVYFVCRYCHTHKFQPTHIYPTAATTAAGRHLREQRPGHGHVAPGKPRAAIYETPLRRMLKAGIPVSQAVANELGGFNNQRFRLAAVGWLVDNNYLLSEFEKPAFRDMLAAASPQVEAALWESYKSVRQYVMRLYDFLLPRVVCKLSNALSKIHISFNGWTTKGGK
jgi:hypothetical protein